MDLKILLTNDDGIDAPGLRALEASIPADVQRIVVAPDRERSECGHAATTRTAMVLTQRGPGRWALSGTPVDCVRVALTVLGESVDGVISGVNDGGNLGADIYMSGTVAAAREAALHGIAAVAVSHYRRPAIARSWEHVPRWLDGLLVPLLTREHQPGAFWNVNLPAVDPDWTPRSVLARLDSEPMSIAYQRKGPQIQYAGDYHGRPRRAGTDVSACFDGQISMTRLTLGC